MKYREERNGNICIVWLLFGQQQQQHQQQKHEKNTHVFTLFVTNDIEIVCDADDTLEAQAALVSTIVLLFVADCQSPGLLSFLTFSFHFQSADDGFQPNGNFLFYY